MPTPADQLPPGTDSFARRLATIERAVRELRAAKRLQNSAIGGGQGLLVQGTDGASIRLAPDGGTLIPWLDGQPTMAISSGSSAEIAPGIITATVTDDAQETPYMIIVCPDTDLGTASIVLQGGTTDGYSPYVEIATASTTFQMFDGEASISLDNSHGYDFTTAGLVVDGETWHTMTLSNGWTSYGSTFQAPQYRKMVDGTVMLAGQIKPGTTTNNTTVATLPTGYTPAYDHNIRVSAGTGGAVADIYVRTSGAIQIENTSGTIAWLSLSNIRFPIS